MWAKLQGHEEPEQINLNSPVIGATLGYITGTYLLSISRADSRPLLVQKR
jgi:hypothetical protein